MKQFEGIYRGIVIDNNDPERRGRCKVYIADVHGRSRDQFFDQALEIIASFPDKELSPEFTQSLDKIKEIVPWAEPCMPILGESSSGRYFAQSQTGTISDANTPGDYTEQYTPDLNVDQLKEAPAQKFETEKYNVYDAFTKFNHVADQNIFGYEYRPHKYSNKPKGTFSIPSVGSHLWLMFYKSSAQVPVYFGACFDKRDYDLIFETKDNAGIDYPSSYETNNENDRYRNKFVLNQKGAALEIVNTDKHEKIKLSHYSGSFYEMNNYNNVELATENKQTLVLKKHFVTNRDSYHNYTEHDHEIRINNGNYYTTVGKLCAANEYVKWVETYSPYATLNSQFRNKRLDKIGLVANPILQDPRTTLDQGFKGKVTTGVIKADDDTVSSRESINNQVEGKDPTSRSFPADELAQVTHQPQPEVSPSTQDSSAPADRQLIDQLKQLREEFSLKLLEFEKQLGTGGSVISTIARDRTELTGLVFNSFPATRQDDIGRLTKSEVLVGEQGAFVNSKATPHLEPVDNFSDIPFGNHMITAGNRFNVTAGSGGIRLNTTGGAEFGAEHINIASKQNVIVGDLETHVDGKCLKLTGDVINMTPNQGNGQVVVNGGLGVATNAVVKGGLHVDGELTIQHITAPVEVQITEKTMVAGKTNHLKQKVIGYIPGEAIIGYVEIEGVPLPVKASNTGTYGALGLTDVPLYSAIVIGNVALKTPDDESVLTYPHSHNFANLPLTLTELPDEVRTTADEKGINKLDASVVSASKIVNSNKLPEQLREKELTIDDYYI